MKTTEDKGENAEERIHTQRGIYGQAVEEVLDLWSE